MSAVDDPDPPAEAGPALTRPAPPIVEPPTPEVVLGGPVEAAPRVPGAPRASFAEPPTAPVDVSAQSDGTAEAVPEWMRAPEPAGPRRGLATWALVFSAVGLAAALVVGWAFPLAVVGIVTAALALRRPVESRTAAGWALALGILALLYSAGWLVWAATRVDLLA